MSGPGFAGQTAQLHAFAAEWIERDPIGEVLEGPPAYLSGRQAARLTQWLTG